MIIRSMRDSDVGEIDNLYRKFYENDFYLPSLSNTITHAVIENDNRVLGFGEVKIFAEAIMVLDRDKDDRTKAIVMKALMYKAINDCRYKGIEQLHVSVKDAEFAEILKKHYEFDNVNGIILARKIKEL